MKRYNEYDLSATTQARYALILEHFLEEVKEEIEEIAADNYGDYDDIYDVDENGNKTCEIRRLSEAERIEDACLSFEDDGESKSLGYFLEWCVDQIYGYGCRKENNFARIDAEIREEQEAAND